MLKLIPLGGVAEVTKNMFIYETKRDVLIVDCGAGFPEEETEDKLLLPDFSYLHTLGKNIRGVIITHAHFDHYGALPYFLAEFDVPVFSSRLVLEFLKEKLREVNPQKGLNLQLLKPKRKLKLGDFSFTPFLVNHSVPESFAFCLETPRGKIFHVADYKFDLTPIGGPVFDFESCVRLAQGKVLALLSDCLGACEEGFTQTERGVEETLYRLMLRAKDQVFVTTLSSNIFRIQQIINSARRLGRRPVILGHSIETSIKIARKLGYLSFKQGRPGRVTDESRVVYLVAGSYGQANSALMAVAKGKHSRVSLRKEAMVIFSADPSPPNTKDKVDKMVDLLTIRGAEVHYYELQENLHVSGHGSSGDIQLLMALVRPRFLVPIGGCPRHMRAYSLLAQEMGVERKRVFELFPGNSLLFTQEGVKLGPRISLKERTVLV